MALSLSHNPPTQIWMYKLHFFFLFDFSSWIFFHAGEKVFFSLINRLDTLLPPPSAESLFCASPSSSEAFQNKSQKLWHSGISLCSHRLYHFEDSIFCVESPHCCLPSWWPFLSTQATVQMHALHVAITNLSSLSYITKHASSFLIFVTWTVWNWQLNF